MEPALAQGTSRLLACYRMPRKWLFDKRTEPHFVDDFKCSNCAAPIGEGSVRRLGYDSLVSFQPFPTDSRSFPS